MTSEMRHRLIGLILLIAIAALVAVLLFRSPEQVRVALDLEIPEPPPVPQMDTTPPVSQEQLDRAREEIAQASEDVVAAAESRPEGESLPEPGSKPGAWAVQVASFAEEGNADALAARLRDAGYPAYVRAVKGEQGVLHRVLLGPDLSKDDAERTRRKVRADSRFKLQGLVVPWSL